LQNKDQALPESGGGWDGHRPARRSSTLIDSLVLLALFLVAFVLRWSAARSGGLWRDEIEFLDIVRSASVGDLLSFLHYHESHPPLYYLLTRGWLNITGGSDSAALLLPVTLGAAIVPTLYAVGVRPFGRSAALTAAGLAAFSAMLLSAARQARPYSLLPLLALLSIGLLWRALYDTRIIATGVRRRVWGAYALTMIALLYTHHLGWIVLIAEGIVVSAALVRFPVLRRLWGEWLATLAVILLAYLPWLPALIYQLQHAGHGPPQAPEPPLVFLRLLSDLLLPLPNGLGRSVVPAVLAVAVVVWGIRRRAPRESRPRRPRTVRIHAVRFSSLAYRWSPV